jgi:serine/threonine protein phosphatase PrpC
VVYRRSTRAADTSQLEDADLSGLVDLELRTPRASLLRRGGGDQALDSALPTGDSERTFRARVAAQSAAGAAARAAQLRPPTADEGAALVVRWEIDCHASAGGLATMEDYLDADESGIAGWAQAGHASAYLGIYDGHSGVRAAEHLVDTLAVRLAAAAPPPPAGAGPAELAAAVAAALPAAYAAADAEFVARAVAELTAAAEGADGDRAPTDTLSRAPSMQRAALAGAAPSSVVEAAERARKGWLAGSTATSVVLVASALVVAHVGDSVALLVRAGEPIELTAPHKPSVPAELERIRAAGGWVTASHKPHGGRVNGVLGVARAFGDVEYKDLSSAAWGRAFDAPLVSATPDVLSAQLTRQDECVVLASDGLWDALAYDEVAQACVAFRAAHGGSVAGLGAELVRRAAECNVADNVTVIVAGFAFDDAPADARRAPLADAVRG